MKYHAHIYWNNDIERMAAVSLRPLLQSLGCGIGAIHDKPIGPHSLPMYQVMYDDSNQAKVEALLKLQQMSILLHEDIGIDHVRDHTEGARWINEPLKLTLKFLEQL